MQSQHKLINQHSKLINDLLYILEDGSIDELKSFIYNYPELFSKKELSNCILLFTSDNLADSVKPYQYAVLKLLIDNFYRILSVDDLTAAIVTLANEGNINNLYFYLDYIPKTSVTSLTNCISAYISNMQCIRDVMHLVTLMEDQSIHRQSTLAHLRGEECKSSGMLWKGLPVSNEWLALIKQAKDKIMEFVPKTPQQIATSTLEYHQEVYDFLNTIILKPTFFSLNTLAANMYKKACQEVAAYQAKKSVSPDPFADVDIENHFDF